MADPEEHLTKTSSKESGMLLVKDWFRRAREAQQLHYACANYFNNLHYWLGIPTVVLAAFVGTAVFVSLEQDAGGTSKIVVGMISILAAVLASLQTFLGFSERAEKHRLTAASYASVRRSLELLQTFWSDDGVELTTKLHQVKIEMDSLAKSALDVPKKLNQRVRKALKEKGHHRIFELPPEELHNQAAADGREPPLRSGPRR